MFGLIQHSVSGGMGQSIQYCVLCIQNRGGYMTRKNIGVIFPRYLGGGSLLLLAGEMIHGNGVM